MTMNSKRIFVEKRPAFRVEAQSLLGEFNENLSLSLRSLRLINVYDLVNAEYLVVDQAALAKIEEVYV